MEAAAVAAAARAHGIRFSAIKVISDEYDFRNAADGRASSTPTAEFRTAQLCAVCGLAAVAVEPRCPLAATAARQREHWASIWQVSGMNRARRQARIEEIMAPPAASHAEAATSASRAEAANEPQLKVRKRLSMKSAYARLLVPIVFRVRRCPWPRSRRPLACTRKVFARARPVS